MFKMMINKEN